MHRLRCLPSNQAFRLFHFFFTFLREREGDQFPLIKHNRYMQQY